MSDLAQIIDTVFKNPVIHIYKKSEKVICRPET